MRVVTSLLALLLLGLSTGVTSAAEESYLLREVRTDLGKQNVAKPIKPAWSHRIDQADADSPIAYGDGVVAFSSDGRMCGYSELNGERLWCAGPGSHPAYAAGVIAFAAAHEMVIAVHAKSGVTVWHYAFSLASRGPYPPTPFVWAAASTFLMGYGSNGFYPGPTYGEWDATGKRLWSTRLIGASDPPSVSPPFVFQTIVGSGGYMQWVQHAFKIGSGGGPLFTVTNALDVVAVRPPNVIMARQQMEAEMHQRAFELMIVSLLDGHVQNDYRFEPDPMENAMQIRTGLIEGSAPRIGLEANMVYAGIGQHVYRYQLAAGQGQRPLLISADGRFIAGPHHGSVFVARDDGVWMLHATQNNIEARLVARSSSPISSTAVRGKRLYAGLQDGELFVIDMDAGAATSRAKACPSQHIEAGPLRTYVICAGSESQIVAFPSP